MAQYCLPIVTNANLANIHNLLGIGRQSWLIRLVTLTRDVVGSLSCLVKLQHDLMPFTVCHVHLPSIATVIASVKYARVVPTVASYGTSTRLVLAITLAMLG